MIKIYESDEYSKSQNRVEYFLSKVQETDLINVCYTDNSPKLTRVTINFNDRDIFMYTTEYTHQSDHFVLVELNCNTGKKKTYDTEKDINECVKKLLKLYDELYTPLNDDIEYVNEVTGFEYIGDNYD